jgi:hypothetical protein
MCGLPFHLLDCLPILDTVFTMRSALRSLPLLAIFLSSCTALPETVEPDSALVHAVVSGIHDVVATAHQVWSAQLNLRVDTCRKQLPPETTTREQFIECLKPFDKNDVIVAHLNRLVEVQKALRTAALTAQEIRAKALEALATARFLLDLLQANQGDYAQIQRLEALLK